MSRVFVVDEHVLFTANMATDVAHLRVRFLVVDSSEVLSVPVVC